MSGRTQKKKKGSQSKKKEVPRLSEEETEQEGKSLTAHAAELEALIGTGSFDIVEEPEPQGIQEPGTEGTNQEQGTQGTFQEQGTQPGTQGAQGQEHPVPQVTTTTTMLTVKKVIINGIEVEIEDTPQTADPTSAILYPRSMRSNMTDEKLQEFFRNISKGTDNKFQNPTLEFDAEEKLQDSYDINTKINQLKSELQSYNMLDVFTIIILEKGKESDVANLKQVNILEDFPQVTVNEVAESNWWYRTMVKGDTSRKYISQNLTVSDWRIHNDTEEDLLHSILDVYNAYEDDQQGGPLLFKLVIDKIQMTTERAIDHLIVLIKNVKATDYTGENIATVVSLIRNAVKRVHSYSAKDKHSCLPLDLNIHLCKETFQSTSVDEFNSIFAQLVSGHNVYTFSQGTRGTEMLDVDSLLKLAYNAYNKLSQTGSWTSVVTAGKSVFITKIINVDQCFNCGGTDHKHPNCPRPKNEKVIELNRQKFMELKNQKNNQNNNNNGGGRGCGCGCGRGRGGRGGRGRGRGGNSNKFKPPTEEEKTKQNGHRMINGVEHYYHYKDQWWKPVDEDHKLGLNVKASDGTVTTELTTSTGQQSTTTTTRPSVHLAQQASTNAQQELYKVKAANFTNTIMSALQDLQL